MCIQQNKPDYEDFFGNLVELISIIIQAQRVQRTFLFANNILRGVATMEIVFYTFP